MQRGIPGQMARRHPIGPAIRALQERKRRAKTVSSAPAAAMFDKTSTFSSNVILLETYFYCRLTKCSLKM